MKKMIIKSNLHLEIQKICQTKKYKLKVKIKFIFKVNQL